jgi:hypothetical protein
VGVGIGAAVVLVLAHLASADSGAGLTASERGRLERGEPVFRTREVEGYPWPQVTVYRRVAASPEEVAAVYADFESQAGYLPNLVESRVVRRLARNAFHVFYEYEVTGPNERYTVAVRVLRVPGGFRVTWDLVSARYARRLRGQMRVEAFDSGALVEYTNLVDPGFFGVRLGSSETTARQLGETAQALATHVERLRVEEPEKLRALTRALSAVLDES